MRGIDSSGFGGRQGAPIRLSASVSDGPYRLRSAASVAWPPAGYQRRGGIGYRASTALLAVGRSILPIFFLSIALAAMYLFMDRPLPYFSDSHDAWFRLSHLLLPVAFFTVHLTNRRYGPSYAFAQIVLSFAVCTAAGTFGADIVRQLLPEPVVPGVREVAMFIIAFVGAGFLAIVAFDGARGPRWWTAPLIGSLVAGIAFAILFYPLAYAGSSVPWLSHLLTHGAVLVGAAFIGLVPFWLLRATIPPLPGFGGH